MAQSKKRLGVPLPLPSEGKIFGMTIADVVAHGFDHAMRTQRELCAKAAESFVQGNRDSSQSRTAIGIAHLIRTEL